MGEIIPLKLITIARHIETPHFRWWIDQATGDRPVPGDCFYAPEDMDWNFKFSNAYPRNRRPIFIVLPSKSKYGQWWSVDEMAYNEEMGHHGEGWTVQGELPNVTITPSIRSDVYHANITGGRMLPHADSQC